MDVLATDVVTRLAEHCDWPSISIFLPTSPLPHDASENRIRLKNLVRSACEDLEAQGVRRADAESLCIPARTLVEDDTFWRETSSGLAIFVAKAGSLIHALRLRAGLPERVVVGDRFYLRPLLVAMRPPETFFALALDKSATRLFTGDNSSIKELDLGETPTTIDETLKYDESSRALTTHSFMPGRPSSRGTQHEGSNYAGFGGEKDVETEQTLRFARIIERAVSTQLAEKTAPLLLLGTERLLAAYRDVNTYRHLASEQVTGASGHLSAAQIAEVAREALAPTFRATAEADLAELADRDGTGLASRDAAEVVSAAASGRVKTLFVSGGVGPWGMLDRSTLRVSDVRSDPPTTQRESAETCGSASPCGWDLVDLAAAETLRHGGVVHAFEGGENPPAQGAAAIFRY